MQSMKDPNADSALYIIPNPYGPGTTLVRRPHPPPTTTALDDDFDAITADCTTVLGPRVQEEESEGNVDTVVRRETYHADSKEYGKFGWSVGEAGSALSDLNLEFGKAPGGGMKSVSKKDNHGMDRARSRQSMAEEKDSKRESRISDGGKFPGGVRIGKGDGGGNRSIGTIQEQNTGTTVDTWRVQVAKSGDQEMLEGKGGDKSRGKYIVGDGQPVVIGRTKSTSEQRRSFSNSAYARSERIYSAADLDIPPPPSKYSPSEYAQADMSGTAYDHSRGKNSQEEAKSTGGAKGTSSSSSLDSVLSSFQPSLLHIASVLENLGIRDEEHLRAVGRLSEEIRNREVREVALKKGVTVVEWAMLIDRIRSL